MDDFGAVIDVFGAVSSKSLAVIDRAAREEERLRDKAGIAEGIGAAGAGEADFF